MKALQQLASGLGDGTLWLTGKWLKRLIAAIIEDRAVLAGGAGDEIPTPEGRTLIPRGSGGGGLDVWVVTGGALQKAALSGYLKT